ncbi:MAG: ECF transporter S component [Micrococcales bacterium]|nr:ECF transporter S component [Micrococcales bacterium]NBR61622.1 ECF transporter S component [Actinomycetota bacterium]NBR54972.1 ECF transporter S component [Micrococcales bacterium]NBT48744.1 ECF transporter S component [Actinomycetota bacterium]NBY43435.1 ECF transporter S component [Micrococcales bacterium]
MRRAISILSVSIAGLASVLMFAWPLLIATNAHNESAVAQGVFIVLMPLMLVLILVEFASGDIGSKQLALLGVLIALNAVIRLLGAGTSGIETAFFLVILGAYIFGSGFGFLLGSASILVSAILTGGIGPWLPFQMMGVGLVGLGAGILPKLKKLWQSKIVLVLYSLIASFVYGSLMTLWNWPFLAGTGTSLSYVAGDDILNNLKRFFQYELVTGGFFWDMGRAITTSLLILLTGTALITTLNRAAIRAGVLKRN